MTTPRRVVPGATYLVTRRCTQRQFLLRPDEETRAIFAYCLAEAVVRHGMRVLSWTTMSNHYHLVVHDPRGVLPAFLARLHRLVALCLNARWGRRENLWASGAASVVRLVEPQDELDKVVYALANPLADDLDDDLFHWPGASSWAPLLAGRTIAAHRPSVFFRRGGPMPQRVVLRVEAPEGWPGGVAAWVAAVRAGVEKCAALARERRIAAGRRVVGRKALMRASHRQVASLPEPRRERVPEVACGSAERRELEVAALRSFRAAYAAARLRWSAGERDVVFPFGTYQLRVEHAVVCAPLTG